MMSPGTSPPGGNPQARRIADDALGILVAVLAPVLADGFRAAYGPDWRGERGFRAGAGIGQPRSLDDPQAMLQCLQASTEFDRAILPSITVAPEHVFRLATDIKTQRNALYHRASNWSAADAWQLADRVTSLITAMGQTGRGLDDMQALKREAAAIEAGPAAAESEQLRREYTESVLARTSVVDLAGINAGVGSRVVQVRLEDIYEEPTLVVGNDPHDPNAAQSIEDLILTRRAVVLGGPGSGKSTLVRRVARMLALGETTGAATPILITASHLAAVVQVEPTMSMRRYITQRLTERFGVLLERELSLGRATVLVDGLDEIGDEALRGRTAALVGEFMQDHPNISLIATSRRVGYRRPPSWANVVEVEISRPRRRSGRILVQPVDVRAGIVGARG